MEKGLGITKDMAQMGDDYVFADNDQLREHWQRVERATMKSWGSVVHGYRKIGAPLVILHYRCMKCGYLESYAPTNDIEGESK
jgi:hypothetical protein